VALRPVAGERCQHPPHRDAEAELRQNVLAEPERHDRAYPIDQVGQIVIKIEADRVFGHGADSIVVLPAIKQKNCIYNSCVCN